MSDKVDIFELLKRVDNGDLDYWNNLTDKEKKSISFVVASRWMSGTKNAEQIASVNALLNPLVFPFGSKHAGLLYRLMLVASSGTQKKYNWIGKKKISKFPLSVQLIAEYYGFSDDRAESYLKSFNLNELLECASELGYDDATVKKLKNEHK